MVSLILRQQKAICNRKYFLWTTPRNMRCSSGLSSGLLLFLLYINEFNRTSKILDLHLFVDDSNFYSHKKLQILELNLINELCKIQEWLWANKLSLNLKKTNITLFHPLQKKLNGSIVLCLNGKIVGQIRSTKYLGVLMDCHLNRKDHVYNICKKLTRSVGKL